MSESFEVSTRTRKPAPLPSSPGRKLSFAALLMLHRAKTFRSGWASQPGRGGGRCRSLTTKRPLMPGKLARGDNRTGPRQFALNGIPQGTDSFREAVANYQVGGKNEVKSVFLPVTATVPPL